VEHSLRANDLTVVSIFVNPAQFAPHEDLDSYPRTLSTDLSKLSELAVAPSFANNTPPRTIDAVFAPSVAEMYPNGIERDVELQKGTFIEIKGYSHQMEGRSRPDFFRGVATAVMKLFNVIEVKQYL
jgi:pantoate--beta-alanine ligase